MGRDRAWAHRVERDGTDRASTPKQYDLATLIQMADVLNVSLDYLLAGRAGSGDSEFIARLRGMEPELNSRAKRMVLTVAQQEVAEAAAERAEASSSYDALMADLRKRAEAEGRDSVLPLLDELAAQPPTTHRDPGPPAQEAVS